MQAESYNIITIIPYVAVLGLAVAGLDVIMVLALGMILSGRDWYAGGNLRFL